MDTLNQEIISLIKQLPKAESETPSVHGLTELELTCGKILDRLLIASGHGRPPIRLQIGEKTYFYRSFRGGTDMKTITG